MKIEFNEKELKNLVSLVYLASFIVDMRDEELGEDEYDDFQDVINKIYRSASKTPLRDLVDQIRDDEYEAAEALFTDPKLNAIIESYESENFWERLVQMLGMRDITEKMSEQEFASLAPEKKGKLVQEHIEKYLQEFNKHGVVNLRIVTE
ncbi:MAG: hypothetical protein GXO74_09460 [Calditrichaeota bacterium]|nr:hypothetical protein [Calditrichota bacterium]